MATAILAMSSQTAHARRADYAIASIPPPYASFPLISSRARATASTASCSILRRRNKANRSRAADVFCEEVADVSGDQVAVLFEREVTGVEQVELQVLQITFVGFGPLRRKNEIVFSPHDQRRRLVLTEVSLPLRVEWRGRGVGVEEGEIYLVRCGGVGGEMVDRPLVGGEMLFCLYAVCVV